MPPGGEGLNQVLSIFLRDGLGVAHPKAREPAMSKPQPVFGSVEGSVRDRSGVPRQEQQPNQDPKAGHRHDPCGSGQSTFSPHSFVLGKPVACFATRVSQASIF